MFRQAWVCWFCPRNRYVSIYNRSYLRSDLQLRFLSRSMNTFGSFRSNQASAYSDVVDVALEGSSNLSANLTFIGEVSKEPLDSRGRFTLPGSSPTPVWDRLDAVVGWLMLIRLIPLRLAMEFSFFVSGFQPKPCVDS